MLVEASVSRIGGWVMRTNELYWYSLLGTLKFIKCLLIHANLAKSTFDYSQQLLGVSNKHTLLQVAVQSNMG